MRCFAPRQGCANVTKQPSASRTHVSPARMPRCVAHTPSRLPQRGLALASDKATMILSNTPVSWIDSRPRKHPCTPAAGAVKVKIGQRVTTLMAPLSILCRRHSANFSYRSAQWPHLRYPPRGRREPCRSSNAPVTSGRSAAQPRSSAAIASEPPASKSSPSPLAEPQ